MLGLCSDQQLSFLPCWTGSFPHNNTKSSNLVENFLFYEQPSYGLSFSGFAINLSLIVRRNSGNRANPENEVHKYYS